MTNGIKQIKLPKVTIPRLEGRSLWCFRQGNLILATDQREKLERIMPCIYMYLLRVYIAACVFIISVHACANPGYYNLPVSICIAHIIILF